MKNTETFEIFGNDHVLTILFILVISLLIPYLLKNKSRDDLSKYLYDMGIQTRNFFWPLHLQSALPEKYYSQRNLPVSEHIGKNGLYLPLGEHLNENDQRYISKCIRTFMEE